jgi:hypothetical protein
MLLDYMTVLQQLTFHCAEANKTLGLHDRTCSKAPAGVICLYCTYKNRANSHHFKLSDYSSENI